MSESSTERGDLAQLRQRIDELDNQILRLLNQRMHLVRQIGTLKNQAGLDPLDLGREQAIFRRLARANQGPLPWGAVKRIFREILAASRDLQYGPDSGAF